MKKIFFLLSMFFAFGVSTQAMPVRPGIKKVLTLADGTAVAAELKGDEYMAWWETADGRKFVQSESDEKTFVAADINAQNAVLSWTTRVQNAWRVRVRPRSVLSEATTSLIRERKRVSSSLQTSPTPSLMKITTTSIMLM